VVTGRLEVHPRPKPIKISLSAGVDPVMRSNHNVGGNLVEGSGTWAVVCPRTAGW